MASMTKPLISRLNGIDLKDESRTDAQTLMTKYAMFSNESRGFQLMPSVFIPQSVCSGRKRLEKNLKPGKNRRNVLDGPSAIGSSAFMVSLKYIDFE